MKLGNNEKKIRLRRVKKKERQKISKFYKKGTYNLKNMTEDQMVAYVTQLHEAQ